MRWTEGGSTLGTFSGAGPEKPTTNAAAAKPTTKMRRLTRYTIHHQFQPLLGDGTSFDHSLSLSRQLAVALRKFGIALFKFRVRGPGCQG